ncbi:MAG: protein kinase family protein [Verrucomicrobia bacterium]|nr:protein kinase family protein [Verrucomicrobiota bacterium]
MIGKIGIRISNIISSVSKHITPTAFGAVALCAISALGLFYLNKYFLPKTPTITQEPVQNHPSLNSSLAASLEVARLCRPSETEENLQSLAVIIETAITPLEAASETNRFMCIADTPNSTPILVGKTETGWIVQPQKEIASGGFASVLLTEDFAVRKIPELKTTQRTIELLEKTHLIKTAINPDGKTIGIQPPRIGLLKKFHIIETNYFETSTVPCEVSIRYENNLLDFIKKQNKPIPPDKIRKICGHIAFGMNSLFEKEICHLDIKPQNILYDGKLNRIDITDFDGAVIKTDKSFEYESTSWMTLKQDIDQMSLDEQNRNFEDFYLTAKKTAVFSLGSTFYQIACLGQKLPQIIPQTEFPYTFTTDYYADSLKNRNFLCNNIQNVFTATQQAMLLLMLDPDRKKRPDPQIIANTFFFSEDPKKQSLANYAKS